MSQFDDIKKRAGQLDDRLKEEASNSTSSPKDEFADMGNFEVKPKKDHGPLYWFFYHSYRIVVGGPLRFARRRPFLGLILFVIFAGLVFGGRAWYQPGALFLRKYFIVGLAVLLLLYLLYRSFRRSKFLGKAVIFFLTAGLTAGVWFWGKPMVNYLALYYHFNSLNKIELAELPVTNNERIQPINSIATLASQEALNETESASSPDFIRRADGRFDFSMAIGPSPRYPLQRFTQNLNQVISVSATSPSPDFSSANRHPINFDVGEQLLFSKYTMGAAIKRFNLIQYFNFHPDQVRFIENASGEWVQVVSLVRWKGVLFPRPVFGGVLVMDQYEPGPAKKVERIFMGKGRFVKPEDIQNEPWLKGQNLMPEQASSFTAESFRFHRGFLAPFPGYHEGDIRIPHLQDDQNGMPFVTWFNFDGVAAQAQNGLYDYYGLEPYLEGKSGLNLSLFLPGDGSPEVFYMDHSKQESGLFGSSAVAVKIRESRKEYDWSASAAVESRPFIRDLAGKRRMFWLTTVVTKSDQAGKSFVSGAMPDITLTDALGRQVVWIEQENISDTKLWEQQILHEIGPTWGWVPEPVSTSANPEDSLNDTQDQTTIPTPDLPFSEPGEQVP